MLRTAAIVVIFGAMSFFQAQTANPIVIPEAERIIGTEDSGHYLALPVDFERGNGDTLYVLDIRSAQAVAYSGNGRALFVIGGRGQGPGEFESPRAMTFSSGSIFIADSRLNRVSEFSSNGDYLRSFTVTGTAMDVAATERAVYVATINSQVLVHRITRSDSPERTAFVGFQQEPFASIPEGTTRSAVELTLVNGTLVVGLPRTGQIVAIPLSGSNALDQMRTISVRGALIDSYWEGFRKRQESMGAYGSQSLPSPIRFLTPWGGDSVLAELGTGIGGNGRVVDGKIVNHATGVVINLGGDGLPAAVISCADPRSWHLRRLGENEMGWLSIDQATLMVSSVQLDSFDRQR